MYVCGLHAFNDLIPGSFSVSRDYVECLYNTLALLEDDIYRIILAPVMLAAGRRAVIEAEVALSRL